MIGDEGFILSNEFVPKRAKIIVGNFERLGIKNAIVTSLDTKELGKMFDGWFDAVICDAPCSGEGMFRKCDEAIADWSEENVRACAERQLEILSNLAGVVRKGGQLLYSTCTLLEQENQAVVERFLREHEEFALEPFTLPEPMGAVEQGMLTLWPHIHGTDGFFMAKLRKSRG